MKFFGREREVAELRKIRELSYETARVTVVTGRRRVRGCARPLRDLRARLRQGRLRSVFNVPTNWYNDGVTGSKRLLIMSKNRKVDK